MINAILDLVRPAFGGTSETPSVPYPGKRASFVLEKGNDWGYTPTIRNELVRKLCFVNTTEGSLLKRVHFLGYSIGEIKLQVIVRKNITQFKDYLALRGIENYIVDKNVFVSKQSGISNLIKHILDNNDFPEAQLDLIKKLANCIDWRKVTPVTEEEQKREDELSSKRDTCKTMKDKLDPAAEFGKTNKDQLQALQEDEEQDWVFATSDDKDSLISSLSAN